MRPFYEHFQGQVDVDWLPEVGARQWVLLTKDQGIRRRQLEVDAILNAGVKAFVLTSGGLARETMAALWLRAMRKIRRICQQRGPFIYKLTSSGAITQISNRTLRRLATRGRR